MFESLDLWGDQGFHMNESLRLSGCLKGPPRYKALCYRRGNLSSRAGSQEGTLTSLVVGSVLVCVCGGGRVGMYVCTRWRLEEFV